jgi:hypothetical protein
VVDSSTWRTNAIRLESSNKIPYQLRIVAKENQLGEVLLLKWDIVIVSGYLEVFNCPTTGMDLVASAYEKGRVGGIICNATLVKEGMEVVNFFKEKGIPCALIPFCWQEPSKKTRIK